jgi:hypothetical protein
MRASSSEDLKQIAISLKLLRPSAARAALLSVVYSRGLMIAPWWLRGLIKLVCWRHRIEPVQAWAMSLANDHKGKMADAMMDGLIEHVVNGKDKTNPASAGGFNQEELDQLLALLIAAIATQSAAEYLK